jgi:anti-anti-sigma regulatory factor
VIRISTKDNGATLSVAGDLVAEAAALLERECTMRLEAEPALTLDLSDLRRVDDPGLEVLCRLRKRGARISRCPGVVAKLLEGCGS